MADLNSFLSGLKNQENSIQDDIFREMEEESKDLNDNFTEHIVLLGDSILDNENYIIDGPCVTDQFRNKCNKLNLKYKVTNCAVDGATTYDLLEDHSIQNIPNNATYIVLSIGGNDGLISLNEFSDVRNWLPWNFIRLIYKAKHAFIGQYNKILNTIKDIHPNCKIIGMTIYYPVFDESVLLQLIANLGVNILSNVILHTCNKHNIPVIDLRKVFDKRQDYANSIEPGIPGGDKIVNNSLNIIHNYHGNNIYFNREYSEWIDINKYYGMNNVWHPRHNKYQKGNVATRFFRRAFNEGNNRDIKVFSKIFVVGCVVGITCFIGLKYKPNFNK